MRPAARHAPVVALGWLLASLCPPSLAAQAASETAPRVVRADPRFDALIPAGARVTTVSEGFTWLEGPVWDRRTGALFFSDIPANAVYRWTEATGARLFLQPSGYSGTAPFQGREPGSNGLLLDSQGRLILCQHGDRRIVRLEPDGRRTVLADRFQGRRLNSPNDAVLRSNGDLYFTDPPFGLPGAFDDPQRELEFSGVYRLAPDGTLTLVTREVRTPNGIAFSPDERTLYVSNADRDQALYLAFAVRPDGSLGPARTLHDATHWAREYPGAPDGMKVDTAGNLFAAGPGGVHVFAPDGTHLGSLILGVATSNVAWGGDGSELYITAGTGVYRVRTSTRGW